MKSILTRAIPWILFVVLLCAGVASLVYGERTAWPAFRWDNLPAPLKALNVEPEVVVQPERDYAYRLGDIVYARLYILQKPGTVIDMHSLAVEGSFELLGEPQVISINRPDGTKLIKSVMRLQSFALGPQWELKANLSYRILSNNDERIVSLPVLVAHSNKIWDGRELVQSGHLSVLFGWHLLINGAMILFGVFGAWFFHRLYQHYEGIRPLFVQRVRRVSRFVRARKLFDAVWAAMEAGERTARNYARISRLVRRLYLLEAKTTLEVEFWIRFGPSGPSEHLEILQLCDCVLYHGKVLTEFEHRRIKEVFDELVPGPDSLSLVRVS